MIVLGIDTSTATATVAVLEGTSLRAERTVHRRGKHGEVLLGLVSSVLEDLELRVEDLGLIAIGLGPGGFSSLRVGLATAKGLALAFGAPIVGVSSAQAIARGIAPAGRAVVLSDAQRGEVYGSAYAFDAGGPVTLCAPFLAAPEVAVQQLRAAVGDGLCVLGGDGVTLCEPSLAEHFPETARAPQVTATPRAALLGLEALAAFERRGGDDLAGLEPLYVRPSDAALPSRPLRLR